MRAASSDPEETETNGWLFRADRGLDPAEEILRTRGVIATRRVTAIDQVERMRPGDPCFLHVSGRGPDGPADALIVASGVVVDPRPHGTDLDGEGGAADERTVEVVLHPLVEPIPRGRLNTHAVLARSDLFTRREQTDVLALRPDEVAALRTAFDLTTTEPQIPFARVLAPDDGPDFSIERLDGGGWTFTRHEPDGSTTSTIHPTATEATARLAVEAERIGAEMSSQVSDTGSGEDLEPFVIFDGGAGRELSIFKIAHRYAVVEVHEDGQVDPPMLGALDDLATGMVSLAGHLAGEHDHGHHHHGHDHDHSHDHGHGHHHGPSHEQGHHHDEPSHRHGPDHGDGHACGCGRPHD